MNYSDIRRQTILFLRVPPQIVEFFFEVFKGMGWFILSQGMRYLPTPGSYQLLPLKALGTTSIGQDPRQIPTHPLTTSQV